MAELAKVEPAVQDAKAGKLAFLSFRWRGGGIALHQLLSRERLWETPNPTIACAPLNPRLLLVSKARKFQ